MVLFGGLRDAFIEEFEFTSHFFFRECVCVVVVFLINAPNQSICMCNVNIFLDLIEFPFVLLSKMYERGGTYKTTLLCQITFEKKRAQTEWLTQLLFPLIHIR